MMEMNMRLLTERAVVARIKRKLAHEYETISFGVNPWSGNERVWRHVNVWSNTITGTIDDLAAYARDLGVLQPHERVTDG
jgi:hypothetical protein